MPEVPYRILVAAPEEPWRERLCAFLAAEGRIASFPDTESALPALAALERCGTAAVLVVAAHHAADELEFLRRLRLEPGQEATPVLLLVEPLNEDERVSALEAGADECLSSHCGERELRARVRRMLERARAHREEAAATRRTRHWFESVLEGIDDHLVVYDREWRYTYLNEAAARVLCKPREELIGRCIWDVFPEAVGNQYHQELQQAVAEQRVIRSEHFYAPWNTWYANQIYPSPAGVIVFSSVISDRKEAEEQVRRSEARYRALVEAGSQVVWNWDSKTFAGDHSGVQRWWEELTGQSPEEQVGDGWLQVVHPEDREAARSAWTTAMEMGTKFEVEYRVLERNGGYRHFMSRAVPVVERDQPVREWVGTLYDITERKQAEIALQESNRTLQALVDASPLALMILDVEGRVRLWNPAAEHVYGWTGEEVVGAFLPAIPEDKQDEFRRNLECIASGESILGRTMRQQKRGEVPFEARLWAVPLGCPEGRVQCLAIVEDLTDRLRLEAELEQRVADLAEADRRKDEFLAMLAHELRNPLGPIINAVYAMQMRGETEPAVTRCQEVIARQSAHMARLLDDLLDVSRITRGKIELRLRRLDLVSIVQQSAETCRSMAELRNHRFAMSLPSRQAVVEADPARLQQIVGNLLGNAFKYTPSGGRIDLSVEIEEDAALISVRDTGIGIAAELLPRVFDLFIQGNRSLARAEGGLGIGLTMVRSLVEMHGGAVEARSHGPGRGSEFRVRLPLAAPTLLPQTEPPSPTLKNLARHRIMVVDDLKDGADSLGDLLEAWGYEVCVVYHGEDALRHAATFAPEIVLLDIGLPGLDGYEAARGFRQLPATRRTCLVAFTGYGKPEDVRRAHEAGFDHHLTKPVDPESLRKLLVELGRRQRG